jgi:uncharacterized protein YdbL (DUF1318 family)
MASRFDSTLRKGFDLGALGFSKDGLVVLRDPGSLELKDRVGMQKAVADDNRDREAVYKEIAVANGHADWEKNIRSVFAKQWVDSARGGWWYQTPREAGSRNKRGAGNGKGGAGNGRQFSASADGSSAGARGSAPVSRFPFPARPMGQYGPSRAVPEIHWPA